VEARDVPAWEKRKGIIGKTRPLRGEEGNKTYRTSWYIGGNGDSEGLTAEDGGRSEGEKKS